MMRFLRDVLTCSVLLAGLILLVHLDDLVLDADRAINITANEAQVTAQSLQYRLDSLDPVIAKAGRNLDSLDRAIKTHEAATRQASDELHGTFQNANAILLQAGLTSDEVRRASMEQRASLLETNKELTGAIKDTRLALADIRAAVKDPAIHSTLENVNATTTDVRQAVNELTHPPKQTRGQKVLKFLLQIVFGNAVQGAVRR
jgi:hypothetical protein